MRRARVMSLVQRMGGMFVLAAIAIATGIGVIPLWRARASLGWTETRCHVQRSEVDPARPGSGALCLPADAPATTPGRQIDWFLEVRVHLPLGPDVTVRAPIEVPPGGGGDHSPGRSNAPA